jgi:phospholipid transport system substrate-binding protein
MMTHDKPRIRRRDLLVLAITPFVAGAAWRHASAETANDASATTPVQRLDDALLAAMRAGKTTAFAQRYAALAPVIEQTFDLEAVLAASIGLGWPALQTEQKTQLVAAFRRYTVASYTANFDSYTGQTFQILPAFRSLGNGQVIVETNIVPADGSPTRLDYVMRNGTAGWKVVDVLSDGSISRVAVQRSDFRHLLTSGGATALMAGLQTKVANLSGGMLS